MGVANATVFTFESSNWIDPDGIQSYYFFYSFNDGDTYIPLDNGSPSSSSMTYKFAEIFESVKVQIKCNVVSLKGFSTNAYTSFPLAMRAAASSSAALSNFNLDQVSSEPATLQAGS